MNEKSNSKIQNNIVESGEVFSQLSNPLKARANISENALDNYSQTVARPKYDKDVSEIVEIVRILNNMAPIRMPEYNFDIEQINGDRYYKPDGSLLLVREYDREIVRDYYYNPNPAEGEYSISRILEHDKNTGRLKVKIEPITRKGSRLKTNIAIFDEKINNKYIIIQLSDEGIVNNISEFSGKGKSFQTLFRNIHTFKPVRYLEGRDNKENGFEMIDCLFTENGDVARIKRYNNKREVNINYTETQKQISVKTKINKLR